MRTEVLPSGMKKYAEFLHLQEIFINVPSSQELVFGDSSLDFLGMLAGSLKIFYKNDSN